MAARPQHQQPMIGRKPRTFEENLAYATHPRDLSSEAEADPSFVPRQSTRVFCQAFMRGLCPNGTACYLVHPPIENIVAAIDELKRHNYLLGSSNKHWCERAIMKDARPKGQTTRQICIKFLADRCPYRNECIHGHFVPWTLRNVVEPEDSPFVTRFNKGKSRAVATEGLTTTSPVIALPDQETEDLLYETPLGSSSKLVEPPLPPPMPSTYDDSSATSDSSSSGGSDCESFHTGHSPRSEAALPSPEETPKVALPAPRTEQHLCINFYRSGICHYRPCRFRHERPPPPAPPAKVTLPVAPMNSHSLSDRPAPSLSATVSPSSAQSASSVRSTPFPSPPFALHPVPSHRAHQPVQSVSIPHSRQRSILLHALNRSDSGSSSASLHIPPDVCPDWYAHGACSTRGCEFVHSLPEPSLSIPVRLPAQSFERSRNERLFMGQSHRENLGVPVNQPHGPSQPLLPSRINVPHAPISRPVRQPGIVNDHRPPPGVCYYWFNDRVCPHRHPCSFRHDMHASAPLPTKVPGNHNKAVPPVGPQLGPHNAISAAERSHHPVLSSMSPMLNGVVRPHAPSRVPQTDGAKNPLTNAALPRSTRQPQPQSPSTTPSAPSSIRVSSVSTSFPHNAQSNGALCNAAPSAPPGLPAPKPSVEEDYSKEGLFTPEQALRTNAFLSSTTDRFLRDNPSLPSSKSSRGSRPRGPSYPPEMQHVVNEHIKITLGPGFTVQTVLTQNETRWLIIGNLPGSTTKEALTHLIEGFGGTVSEMQMPEAVAADESISVRVQMSSHVEAVAVANGLDGMTALRSSGSLSVRPTLHRAAAKSQVSDSEIRISWKLPTINLYAGFGSVKAAQKAVAAADGYDWDGYWVTASIYDGFPVVGEHNVRFCGLPPDVKHKLVRQRFHCSNADINTDRPFQILRDFGIPQVEARVREFGRVVDFHATPGPYKDGVVRAWCRFESSDIAGVARELNGIPQHCLNLRKVSVWRIHSLKYPINRSVYGFIGEEIHNLREATLRFRRGCNVRIFDHDQWQDKVTIEISAEDSKSLQEIKSRLVDIAQGEIIMDGNVPLWDRFFSTSFGTEWMNTIRHANPSVLIIIRKIQTFMRVIGAPEKRTGVIAAIRAHVATLRGKPIHTIPLPGAQFGLFMHPALLAAREQHGADNLWLDIQRRQLCVRGDEAMYKNVQAAVHTAMKAHPRHLPHNRCPVCFDPPTSPVVLSCGDTYCKDCLASYLAAGTETRQFPLTCFGADGKCKEPVPLVVARDVLPPAQWEQLIAAAFNAHIATKPDEFRFCPTPDCQQVYRPGAKDSVYSCPACLVRICPYCDVEYHEGITCDDRTHRIDSAFDEYVRTHEVKQCPGCKAPIERAEGCNHMTCTRCHTHTCWECMETFDKGVGIYDHMREAHGSIGV